MRNDVVTPGGKTQRLHIHRKDKDLHDMKAKFGKKHKDWSILPRHIPAPDRAQRGRRQKGM